MLTRWVRSRLRRRLLERVVPAAANSSGKNRTMAREFQPLSTTWNGQVYRSRTEARWAVFFDALAIHVSYEPQSFDLSTGARYLPDFYLTHFSAWFEVKPANDAIVTEECVKARTLANDQADRKVWLAMGPPGPDQFNILPLNHWPEAMSIEEILSKRENRFQFREDRRDADVYWLHSEFVDGAFSHSYLLGGPGTITSHERLPLVHRRVEAAYAAAASQRFP